MMVTAGRCCFVLLVLCFPLRPTNALAQQSRAGAETVEPSIGGLPIAVTRRRAIDAAIFHRPLDPAAIRNWMELGSRCTIAEFELFTAPLSQQEQKLLQAVRQMPAPIVNRLHFAHLRGVLRNKGIIALELEQEARHKGIPHTTPAVENELFGAFDCVFASVGPPNGTPRYGDVIIRLKDSVREQGWATPFSGMHFLSAIRGKDAARMLKLLEDGKTLPTEGDDRISLGFDDRLHYSHYIVTEREWNQALAYQAILTMRNAGESAAGDQIRKRIEEIIGERDPTRFWELFIPSRETGLTVVEQASRQPLGYLEAKFPEKVSIDFFTSIEVPADKLAEVRTWPEAGPYLQLIRAQTDSKD